MTERSIEYFAFAVDHAPFCSIDLELRIEGQGIVVQFGGGWNRDFNCFVQHGHLAGDGRFTFADFDFGRLEFDR